MSIGEEFGKLWCYIEFYPEEDEPDFDGVHFGGIKGIRRDAPDNIKALFKKYQDEQEEAAKNHCKL